VRLRHRAVWGPAARGGCVAVSWNPSPPRNSAEKARGRRGDIEEEDAVCFPRLVAVKDYKRSLDQVNTVTIPFASIVHWLDFFFSLDISSFLYTVCFNHAHALA